MKTSAFFLAAFLAACGVDAYAPNSPPSSKKPVGATLQKAATGAFAAFTIASSVLTSAPPASDATPIFFSSSNMVAEKIVREGMYGDYEVDLVQSVDDARSTFKPAKETKSNKGKYTAILAILIVGSFIIPMAQYFWYVRDDDSSDQFFGSKKEPEPVAPPKKKKLFGKKVPEPVAAPPAKKKWF